MPLWTLRLWPKRLFKGIEINGRMRPTKLLGWSASGSNDPAQSSTMECPEAPPSVPQAAAKAICVGPIMPAHLPLAHATHQEVAEEQKPSRPYAAKHVKVNFPEATADVPKRHSPRHGEQEQRC